MDTIKLWARNGDAVRRAIELGELVHLDTASEELRRFLKKNILIQEIGAGLIKMSYLGNAGWRSKRFSTACIAAFPSAMPFW
jgi:hypothetical protein